MSLWNLFCSCSSREFQLFRQLPGFHFFGALSLDIIVDSHFGHCLFAYPYVLLLLSCVALYFRLFLSGLIVLDIDVLFLGRT